MSLRPYLPLVAAAALVAGAASTPVRAAELSIGVPIAQAGVYAFVGNPGLKAMKQAAEESNAAGELGANKIKLIVEDDNSDRGQAITLANRMIRGDQVIALVGAAGTTPALAIAGVANDQKVPMIAMATSPAVTQAGKYSYHVMAGPTLQIDRITSYAFERFKPKTVATIGARDNEGATAQARRAREWLTGKTNVLPEESVLGSDTDFTPLVTKLAAVQPDMVFVSLFEASAAGLVVQARQMGLKSQIVGPTTMVGPGFLRIGGPAVEGVVAPTDYSIDRTDKMNQDFVAGYKKRYGENPDNWAALGYTAMRVVINAIKASGANPTRESVTEQMAKTKDMPSILGTGKYSFDASREPVYDMAILTVKGGKYVLAE